MKFQKLFFIFFIINLLINLIFCNFSFGADFKVNSDAAILFNTNTESIIYEKNAYKKMYPASTTKIITAIITIENCDLTETATVSKNAINLPSGYVSAYLKTGDVLTINELLHLLLVVSANDAANVLAEHIGGSTTGFADMMNSKAKEIGCINTHFTNPYGYHDESHYSTAYDLCLIANYAMKNDIFRQIVSTTTYTTSESKILINTNKLLHKYNKEDNSENIFYYEYATGIKTGYTKKAKNCLIASAKKDNIEYISVILSAQTSETDYNAQRYSDTINLFSTAFENFSLSTIQKSDEIITTVEIPNGNYIRKNLNLKLENDIEILLDKSDLENNLTSEINLYEDKIQAPISKGDILGTISYTYNGNTYTENLVASSNVITEEQMNTYFAVVVITFILFLVFTIIKIIINKMRAC